MVIVLAMSLQKKGIGKIRYDTHLLSVKGRRHGQVFKSSRRPQTTNITYFQLWLLAFPFCRISIYSPWRNETRELSYEFAFLATICQQFGKSDTTIRRQESQPCFEHDMYAKSGSEMSHYHVALCIDCPRGPLSLSCKAVYVLILSAFLAQLHDVLEQLCIDTEEGRNSICI